MERARKVVGLDYPVQGRGLSQRESLIRERIRITEEINKANDKKVKGMFKYFCMGLLCISLLLGQCVYINNQGVEMGKLNSMIGEYKLVNDKNIIKISNLSSL